MKQRLKTEVLSKKVTNSKGNVPFSDTVEFEDTLQKLASM